MKVLWMMLVGLTAWTSSPAQTPQLVAALDPLGGGVLQSGFATVGGRALFIGGSRTQSWLWSSDGTPAGTTRIASISQAADLDDWVAFAGGVVFQCPAGVYYTDGTAGGLVLLTTQWGFELARLGDIVVFDGHGEPWVSDGSVGGTRQIVDLYQGSACSYPRWMTPFDDAVFFSAEDGVHGVELWRTDGTASGTTLVSDLCPGALGSNPAWPHVYRGRLYFLADDGATGRELWETDGTTGGTRRVTDFPPGSAGPSRVYPIDDWLLFQGGGALWAIHGAAPPRRLASLVARAGLGPMVQLVAPRSGNAVFLVGDSSGRGLWRSDGTPAGTALLHTFGMLDRLYYSVPVDGHVAFGLRMFGTATHELWSTDGTVAGTGRIASFTETGLSLPHAFGAGRRAWLAGWDVTHGDEPWRTDGTAAGTARVADLVPGTASSRPRWLGLAGGHLFFAAIHPTAGFGIWALFPGATSQPIGPGCGDSAIPPALYVTDPVLGSTATVSVEFVNATAAGFVVIGAPTSSPIALSPSCVVLPLPGSAAIAAGFAPVAGRWSGPLGVPSDPALEGVDVVAQAALFPSVSAFPFDLSNGVWLTLGR